MNHSDVKIHLDRRPFAPLTIHTAAGDMVSIKSAELAFLHPRKHLLFVASDTGADGMDCFIDTDLITQISTDDGMELMRRII